MSVSAVNSSSSTAAAAAAAAAKKTLGSEDFMKLLTVQMANQDPMSPMEDTAYIAQMAQFTSLNQTQTMVKEMGYLRSDMQLQSATSMIGRSVTVQTDKGTVTGIPTAVTADTSSVYLTIDGANYTYGSVIKVAPVATPTSE